MRPSPAVRAVLVIVIAVCGASGVARAMGTEEFGNKPLGGQDNYRAWRGLMPLLNDENRVYQKWVNGDEYFYYRGHTEALSDFLARFAAMESPVHEVIFRPGPGRAETFDGRRVHCDWSLHVVGGIAASLVEYEGTDSVWDTHPTLTVFIDDSERIKLDEVKVPDTVAVVQVADLRKRYVEGLKSENARTRLFAASFLTDVDPFNEKNVTLIADLLNDEDTTTHASAAFLLRCYGVLARGALPQLEKAAQGDDKQVRDIAAKSIETIRTSPERKQAANDFRETEERIEIFAKQFK